MILIGAVLIILFAAFLIALYAYRIAFYNNNTQDDIHYIPNSEQYQRHAAATHELVDKMFALSYEEVRITSDDGLTLYGRYYHVEDGAPLQIQMHGYRGNAYRDFCGGHYVARKMGHNTLVVDQRAHGRSEGHTISFGIQERMDCLRWIRYAVNRFGSETPIFLVGVSMGAATVLMASDLNLPENVVGIIADCPYSSPKEIIIKVCGDMKLPGRLAYPFVVLAGLVFGGFRLWTSSAVESVKHAKTSILILHGEDDRFVPCDMSRKIRDANPGRVKLETFPDAGHALSCLEDPQRYEQAVRRFVFQCLENWSRHER